MKRTKLSKLLLAAFAFCSITSAAPASSTTENVKPTTGENNAVKLRPSMPNMQNIKFKAIEIDCDGTSNIVIEKAEKYDLKLVMDEAGEQSVEIKNGILYIECKKQAAFKSLNVSCTVKVPHNVEFVKISAGSSDIVVRGYSGKLKIDAGTLELSINSGLANLSINSGTLKGQIYKLANHVKINSGTCDVKLYVEKTAGQKIDINSGMGECAIYLPTGARVSYDTTGFIKCKSDFPNYLDLDGKYDIEVSMTSAKGNLNLLTSGK